MRKRVEWTPQDRADVGRIDRQAAFGFMMMASASGSSASCTAEKLTADSTPEARTPKYNGGMTTSTVIKVEGMHCDGCVKRVTSALSKVPSVEMESVEIGAAHVRYDPAVTSPDSIAKAVDAIGFTAKPVQ